MSIAKPTRPALLLLEPEAEVREVIAELLEQAGWRVVQASGEPQALALLESEIWDALLAHVGTVGSGELLRRARKLRPRLRIVLMTAGSTLPVPPEADALLLKPFSAHLLQKALDRA
jgi:CheY-like chemotaxis protein